jgi:hypothetical protein
MSKFLSDRLISVNKLLIAGPLAFGVSFAHAADLSGYSAQFRA